MFIALAACHGSPPQVASSTALEGKQPVSGTVVISITDPVRLAPSVTHPPLIGTHTQPSTASPSSIATPKPELTSISSQTVAAIGATHISPNTGMRLVYVPEGEFRRGSTDAESSFADEKPQRTIYLESFWIDQTEVTNAMFAAFLNAQRNQVEEGSPWLDANHPDALIELGSSGWVPLSGFEAHPVIEVSWYGAQAYCAWAGERLPTEAEWEKAARGTEAGIYPWKTGSPAGNLLNASSGDNTSFDDGYTRTAPVGSFPAGASPYTALDMAGNVWEWVSDWYGADYYAKAPENNPTGSGRGNLKSARGGAWNEPPEFARAAYRAGFPPAAAFNSTGFRCASSLKVAAKPTPTPDIHKFVLNFNNSVYSVSWSPDGNFLAIGTAAGFIYLWDMVNQETWRILGPQEFSVRDLAYSPDGKLLASGSFNSGIRSGSTVIWRASSGVKLTTLTGFFGAVGGVTWSPDQSLLASGSSNRTLRVWEPSNWVEVHKLVGDGAIWDAAWSPGGALLASGGDSASVTLWDTQTWSAAATITGQGNVYDVEFSPGGEILAIARQGGSVVLWNVAGGKPLHNLQHPALVNSVSFSPDGKVIACAAGDKTVYLWDVTTGELLHSLEGHADYVFAVDFSPDGKMLASGSNDEAVILWDVSALYR